MVAVGSAPGFHCRAGVCCTRWKKLEAGFSSYQSWIGEEKECWGVQIWVGQGPKGWKAGQAPENGSQATLF